MKLKSNETLLKGGWNFNGSSMESDETTKRIEWLISERLDAIATDQSGWEKLYQDKDDNRYWELTYPQSEGYGGGPPQLEYLSIKKAQKKYQI